MIVHKGVRIRDDAKKIGLMQEDIVEEVQIKIDFTERMPWKFWHVPLQYKSLIFIEVCNLILLPTKLTRHPRYVASVESSLLSGGTSNVMNVYILIQSVNFI